MITQKLISFKIDINQLESLDSVCLKSGFNRNKVLNYLVSNALEVLSYQFEILERRKLPYSSANLFNGLK